MNIRKSAVSFLLILCMMISLLPCFGSYNEVEAAQADKNYHYMVEITFGPFAFYYDYGIWDVNELDYVKAETSTGPSITTKDGLPGWYGFDGNTNRVSVTYEDKYSSSSSVDVEVTFSLAKVNSQQITGVTLTGYDDHQNGVFGNQLPSLGGLGANNSGYSFTVPNSYNPSTGEGTPTDTYFSLDGVPKVGSNNLTTTTGNLLLGTIMIAIVEHNAA